jgi:hypothetical protein
MSVVVKIPSARVDYPDADHIQMLDGRLHIFAGRKVVGIHQEWGYAAVFEDKEKSVAELAAELLSRLK